MQFSTIIFIPCNLVEERDFGVGMGGKWGRKGGV